MKRHLTTMAFVLAALIQAGADPTLAQDIAGAVGTGESHAFANGITINYKSDGPADAESILLIMGVGGQLTDWPPELPAQLVKRGYRVVTFDNRDAGLSTKYDSAGVPDWPAIFAALAAGKRPPIAYSLDDMARDTVGLLDALSIKQAHLVGASMGGMIAQIVAAKYPERAMSLTSIMAGAGNPARPSIAKPGVMAKVPPVPARGDLAAVRARELALWLALASPGYPEDEVALSQRIDRSIARSYQPDGVERQGSAVVTAGDRRDALRSIGVPTIVLQGAEDPLVAIDASRDVAASIPGAELRVIPGMGHNLPGALVPTITDAIVSVAARARRTTPARSPR